MVGHLADEVMIRMLRADDGVHLSIRDNGIGFGGDARTDKGRGLQSMAYRSNLIGAVLRMETAPTAGTDVSCALPMTDGGLPPDG